MAVVALSIVSVIAVSVAWATMGSGLSATALARGAGGGFRMKDEGRLTLKAKEPTDVALVNAKLAPDGYTGWHRHAGPSLVVVKTGQITMYAPTSRRADDDGDRRRGASCEASVHNLGTTFVRREGAHNVVNTGRPPTG